MQNSSIQFWVQYCFESLLFIPWNWSSDSSPSRLQTVCMNVTRLQMQYLAHTASCKLILHTKTPQSDEFSCCGIVCNIKKIMTCKTKSTCIQNRFYTYSFVLHFPFTDPVDGTHFSGRTVWVFPCKDHLMWISYLFLYRKITHVPYIHHDCSVLWLLTLPFNFTLFSH